MPEEQDGRSEFYGRLTRRAPLAAGSLPTLVTNAAGLAGAVAVVVFLALYMSTSPGPLVSGFLRFVPGQSRGEARRVLGVIERRLRGWIPGAMLVSLFIGVGSGLGL